MTQFPDPTPIRTSGHSRFAADTMTTRLPANIRNVIAAHPDWSPLIRQSLSRLAEEIAGNALIPPLSLPAWDAAVWERARAPFAADSWHDTEWFFGETYGFRLILEATRYFETGIDPYGPMKEAELAAGTAFLPVTRFLGADIPPAARLEDALHLCMWGNKADISFAAGGALDHSAGERVLLLRDDGAAAAEILRRNGDSESPRRVHIVMDNSGAELAGDLVLAHTILRETAAPVVLHPKLYPTYVSDTTVTDIHTFLARSIATDDPQLRQFAAEVRREFDRGRITIAPDDYWCGTEFLAAMPERIDHALAEAALVVVKGDFNYRRVFRDTIWPTETDPAAAVGRALPYPILLLRTMKSDCLVGVGEKDVATLDVTEPGWRTAGRRGLIQLVATP